MRCEDRIMKIDDVKNNDFSFISQHRYRNVYLNILKTAEAYDYNQKKEVEFDYSFNHDQINILKEIFDIESLRDENEFETFLNATNWVSATLRSRKVPKGPSGSSVAIINDVKEDKYAANCYTHAVILNDVLCALGYKCKYVFCYPIDFHPIDCHVVNLVYSVKKNKWILLDSANNVFFTDNQGNVLSIKELRDCLINDIVVEVNLLDLYVNIKNSNKMLIKQKILTYMSKNMYRFGCYRNSQKDREATCTSVDFYHLVPSTFMNKPCNIIEYNHEKKIKLTEHYLLDPDTFWRTPK